VHAYGEWKNVSEPNCVRDGERYRKCFCGEKEVETLTALGHKNVYYSTLHPTCEEEGYDEYKCSVCSTITKTNTVSKLGHSYDGGYIYSDNATASRDGTVIGYCTVCEQFEFEDVTGSAAVMKNAFAGKKVSVLGDSISTFYGVTNGDAADTTNTEIRNNSMFYGEAKASYLGMTLDDTWWMQTINALGAELLVNNSNSGGYVERFKSNGQPPAYLTPCVNLHDNTGDDAGTVPDIILIYLGTNDFGGRYNSYGNIDDIDFENLGTKHGADYVAASYLEAYAIMLDKIKTAYPNAEIYCLNVLESVLWGSKAEYLDDFNDAVFEVAERLGAYTVDIYRESGIHYTRTEDPESDFDPEFDKYIPADDGRTSGRNTLHPNGAGMTLIANCVIKAIRENCEYYPTEDQFLAGYEAK
ncbi:MAG: hypothetical protein IJW03_00795, partial [Clostridia bacterium]|nr:hypothetical protein [Clostridia bacterium]